MAVMWTNTRWGVTDLWNPNHFVSVTTLDDGSNFKLACHSSPMPSSSSSRESNDANQESINTTIMPDIDCDTVNKEEPVTIEDNSMEPISTEASFPDNTDELAASVAGSMSDNYEEPVSVEASRSDQTEESEETFDRPQS